MADLLMINGAVTSCPMTTLTIKHSTIKIVGFAMMLVLIYCDLFLFRKFQSDSNNWGGQQAQQEIHNYMIMDIVLSNHGFQT
jgi:hypothetical protein